MKVSDNREPECYSAQAKEKWGNTHAYKEHIEKTKDYPKDKWDSLANEMDCIMREFSSCMKNGDSADSEEAQNLVKKLQNHICENYYSCTNEILAGLGQMYICDERFKTNIDKHGDGTADFISKAIETYCR